MAAIMTQHSFDWVDQEVDGERLLRALNDLLTYDVYSIAAKAKIIARLERLGIEIGFVVPLQSELRRVAAGDLDPGLLLMGLDDETGHLYEMCRYLSAEDQRRIVANDPLKVMQADGDHRLISPRQMTRQELNLVINRATLRNSAEQLAELRRRSEKEAARLDEPAEQTAWTIVRSKRQLRVDRAHVFTYQELKVTMATFEGRT